jgi:hypothetical protein
MATKAIARRRIVYARRPRSRRRAAGMTIPVAVLAGFGPLIGQALYGWKSGRGVEGVVHYTTAALTGVDTDGGPWQPMYALKNGLGPIIVGMVVHKVAGRLGVNRALSAAGVPFLRV